MSSSQESTNKGKAVVKQEEPWLPDAVPPAVLAKVKDEPSSSSLAASQPIAAGGPHGDNNNSPSDFVKHVIMRCVAALGIWNVMAANTELQYVSHFATPVGDALQRVAFVFAEALARRAMRLLPGLAWALQLQVPPKIPTPAAISAARQTFAALYPLARVAAAAANRAILEAVAGESAVHVVDLGGASLNQWLELLRLFAERPGGPPSLRLAIVNELDEFLSHAAGMLTQEALRLHVPLVFIPVRSHIDHFSPSSVAALGVAQEEDEALVITTTLQLHRLIADEVTVELPVLAEQTVSHQTTKADVLLRVLRDLMPRLLLLTEQEADHKGADLSGRVLNAFDYYKVLFQDMEAAAGLVERVAMERVLLREEVMDVVAYDGVLRRERHEKMVHWPQRMQMAGFEPALLSDSVFMETETLAHQISGDAGLCSYEAHKFNDGCLFLCSRELPIFSVSAWQPMPL